MKERRKGKESQEAKRKVRSREREGNLEMEYVSRIVEVRYWQPYRLAPLKMSWPSSASPLKKAGAATEGAVSLYVYIFCCLDAERAQILFISFSYIHHRQVYLLYSKYKQTVTDNTMLNRNDETKALTVTLM